MGEMLAMVAAIAYTGSFLVIRKAVKGAPVFDGVFLASLVNLALFGLAFMVTSIISGFPAVNSFYGVLLFVLSAVCTSFLGRLINYRVVELIGTSRASQFMSTQTLFTALIAAFLLHERLSVLNYLGVLAIFLGVYGLSQDRQRNQIVTDKDYTARAQYRKGIIWGLICGFTFGLGNVFRKGGLEYINSAVFGGFVASLATATLFLISYFLRRRSLRSVFAYSFNDIKFYLADGVLTSVAWYSLFWALMFVPASIAQAFKSTVPLFVLLYSVIFLKKEDNINSTVICYCLLSTCGVLILLVHP